MNPTPPPAAELPRRQVHLDFHTSPAIRDVGTRFDAREFARVMKAAHVENVNVFAKCHHGHLYYDTARPERHPGLPRGLDLLGQQVEALHREDIRATIYISVLCDEYAADTQPGWVAREADGRPCYAPWMRMDDVFERPWGAWQILDMSSPYQEYLAAQTAEILERFRPVDGVWFDMTWDHPSTNPHALEAMRRAGLRPEREDDRRLHAHRVARAYTRRLHDLVRASSPRATIYFNCRPVWNLGRELDAQVQHEIESLPTGGWGYQHFQQTVRWTRTFPREYVGMTARFHRSWADFGGLKPYPALEYETSLMMAHGAKCSVGDQMHPRGTLDPAAYQLIGAAFARVEAREPWLRGAVAQTEAAILQIPGPLATLNARKPSVEGATRMLTQLRQQFDIVAPGHDLSRYRLLVLPDDVAVDAPLAGALEAFAAGGGALLASGTSGVGLDTGGSALAALGIAAEGMSPFTATYLRAVDPALAGTLAATDHVVYERGVRVRAAAGAETLAVVVEPYFERSWERFCSHRQTPGDAAGPYAAAVRRGRCAYVAAPVFAGFAEHGDASYRALVGHLLDTLLPDPLVRAAGPTGLEACVAFQPAEGRTVVHLLFYTPERRGRDLDLIEDVIPLRDVALSLRLEPPPAAGAAADPDPYTQAAAWETLPEGILFESNPSPGNDADYSFNATTPGPGTYFLDPGFLAGYGKSGVAAGGGATMNAVCIEFTPTGAMNLAGAGAAGTLYFLLVPGTLPAGGTAVAYTAAHHPNWLMVQITPLTGRIQIVRP